MDSKSTMEERQQLVGFDGASEQFLLRLPRASDCDAAQVVRRDLHDLRALDRALRRRPPVDPPVEAPQLPIKKLRRLMECSWVKDDPSSGWRLELQKNVAVCEAWINAAIGSLSVDEQRAFVDEKLYAQAKQRRRAERAEAQHAKDLQQYFTSQPLVDLLVSDVTEYLAGLDVPLSRVAWLEPSFGDGRILAKLSQAGARYIAGYEIDPALHAAALTLLSGRLPSSQLATRVCQGDFLASQRLTDAADYTVVAVGNPPFGDKSEPNQQPEDLVLRFVVHAAAAWRACVIAFIVPERCSMPPVVAATLEALNECTAESGWRLERSLPLDGHTFELGGKQVKQPSSLVIYTSFATNIRY